MKNFPIHKIKPQNGVIEAKIFENLLVEITRQLFFQITIPLEEFEISSKPDEQNTSIVMDWINLDIQQLSDLENRTFHFPINPEAGYIDASVYLFDVHNLVDVIELRFGKIKNQTIPVEAKLQIDFEYEGTDYEKTKFMRIKTDLVFGELLIWNDILPPSEENLKSAKNFVGQFIDVENFEEPYLDGSWIKIKMCKS